MVQYWSIYPYTSGLSHLYWGNVVATEGIKQNMGKLHCAWENNLYNPNNFIDTPSILYRYMIAQVPAKQPNWQWMNKYYEKNPSRIIGNIDGILWDMV